MQRVCIVAGGPENLLPDLREYDEKGTQWAGVDKGTVYLVNSGIMPQEAFGDFDSITLVEKDIIERKASHIHIYQSEKDQTDLEIAVDWALSQSPKELLLFGITGGRMDHALVNIQLLCKSINTKTQMVLIDKQNRIQMFSPGSYTVEKDPAKKYISFLPFSEKVRGLTLEGFKYSLDNMHIEPGSTLCISNELNFSIGTFSFTNGILIMVRSSD
ncbi:thiamine diphosphokinase [Bacillus gobiensis]|uniref:thiamine diphosphokinase n=1 Tax=Bacillus gobiensis TaxID=1441095 RepID=UPI003D22090C